MSLGNMLDVALGLAFVFILLSTIASAIQEVIATVLSMRGKILFDMMRQILAHAETARPAVEPARSPPPAPAPSPPPSPPSSMVDPNSLSDRVLGHPLISGLSTPNLPSWLSRLTGSARLPSYVHSRNFTTALVETLRDGHDQTLAVAEQVERAIAALPEGSKVKRTLGAFLVEAKGDLDAFRARVQAWYDDAMDRAGGIYKRFAQYMLLALGLVLAVAINADVLRMVDTLWRDKGARDVMTSAAMAYLDTHRQQTAPAAPGAAPATDAAVDTTIAQSVKTAEGAESVLAGLPLPIGWHDDITPSAHGLSAWTGLVARKVLGFLLTAFAVSLGAPFWFDMLQKIANLRGAGPKPERAPQA